MPWSAVMLNEAREYACRAQSMRATDPHAAMFWRRHAAMYLSIAKRYRGWELAAETTVALAQEIRKL